MNNQQISEDIRAMVHPWEIYMHELKIPYHEMGVGKRWQMPLL